LRLSNIYGREYRSQLPNEELIRNSKREHGQYICKYSREYIDKGCTWIHTQKQNSEDGWQFLDIDRCIGAIKQAGTVKAAHKQFQPALEDLTEKARRKDVGKNEAAKLKALFD